MTYIIFGENPKNKSIRFIVHINVFVEMKVFVLLQCMFICSQAATRPNTVIENGSGFTINVGSVVVNMFNTEKFN